MDSLALLSWVRPGERSLGYVCQPIGQGFPNDTRHYLSRTAFSSERDRLTLEDEGPTFLRNVGKNLPLHTASYPRTPTPWTTSHLALSCNVRHTCFAKPVIYLSSVVCFTVDFQDRIFTTFLTKFRDSSVGIVTPIPFTAQTVTSPPQNVQTRPVADPSSYPMDIGDRSLQ